MTEAVFKVRINIDADEPEITTRDIAGSVIKSNDEQRYVLMVAYPALKADAATAQHVSTSCARVANLACGTKRVTIPARL